MNYQNIIRYAHHRAVITASIIAAVLASLVIPATTQACTGIVLHAENGGTVIGRTMEFGFDVESQIAVFPAGESFTTLALNNEFEGFTYTSKYGFVGATALGLPVVVDGVNEEGLYFGGFYFNGLAKFAEVSKQNQENAISSEELGNWILGNFATVEAVRGALNAVTVVGTPIADLGGGPAPLHYAITDASGQSVVVEYTEAGLRIHNNTVNAVTNNPSYDWMLTNLRNYIGLSDINRGAITVGDQVLKPFGQGTGMFGLPGDYSSPSRFVRAVALANTAFAAANAEDSVESAFHVMSNFDIPKGAIREADRDSKLFDYTQWIMITDTQNKVLYWKAHGTQRIEKLDVGEALKSVSKATFLPLETGFQAFDRTP